MQTARTPLRQTLVQKVLPPLTAVLLVLVVWQGLVSFKIVDDPSKLPSPSAVWAEVSDAWLQGTLLDYIWTSVSRGLLGFLLALAIGTPLGLVVARVRFIRSAIGPILSGLQSLPSVAWVPCGRDLAGPRQQDDVRRDPARRGPLDRQRPGVGRRPGAAAVPAGHRTLGATGLRHTWHIVLPAALPGYLAGLKQGWAFSWRSLMAAEIIASSPDLGIGLGQLLENGRNASSMSMVFLAIFLILIVGIAIDLLIFSPLERRVLRSRGLLVRS